MYSGYNVVVKQSGFSVSFEFITQADAFEFASTCMECGNVPTCVTIKGLKEDE